MSDYAELRDAIADGPRSGPRYISPAFVAAANPETVAALLAEVDALRAENERLRAELNEWYSAWGSPLREKQDGER